MKTLALYAGSFNPIHAGHIQVIELAKQIFGADSVGLLLADNPKKTYKVSKDKRSDWIWQTLGMRPYYVDGFVCDFCDEKIREIAYGEQVWDNIVLIRGVRSSSDLDVEIPMAGYNYNISHGKYPTVLIPTNANLRDLSSSAVRVIAKRDFNDFFDALYKPYPPQHISYSKWVDIAEDIWKTYHED
jgi:pantetheine-phosphate adenylyltransferase